MNWGLRIVPEKRAYVIERFGKYTAITKDNVSISIDGVLYVKIVDPKLASYGVENPLYAVIQLAQTTMRSEIGKITLDKSFEERDTLNVKIVEKQQLPTQNMSCMLGKGDHLKLKKITQDLPKSLASDFYLTWLHTYTLNS
ncbi:hypothetical protein POM88_043068 [Heracleum sosnowskyi]|uniref:Band 7 domain-containing protein n=1 Tax=Heracleum sosnowskyi TaxID=360622 RepID=A0AAD8M3S5_9APIA|nr:hypothetical protein POM88_043068 [Heracleum sosnowskyi]